MVPQDLKYTKTHEWVKIEGAQALVGITDHAQHALGDITFVDLPAVGKRLRQFQELGVIESVKAASDLYAPLAGVVAEVNPRLQEAPELVNQDPYGQGWLCRLSEVDSAGLDGLLSAAQYEELIASAS